MAGLQRTSGRTSARPVRAAGELPRSAAARWTSTENLSPGGLFIQTDAAFDGGPDAATRAFFPGAAGSGRSHGRVAWVTPGAREDAGGRRRPGGVAKRTDAGKLDEAAATGRQPPRQPSLRPSGFRVLIVEDNPHIIEMYSYVLKKLATGELAGKVPLEVHFAPDGHHALKQLPRVASTW